MNHLNAIQASRHKKLVPDDKFDRHMKRAKATDINCRKHIFDNQSNYTAEREHARRSIIGSIY